MSGIEKPLRPHPADPTDKAGQAHADSHGRWLPVLNCLPIFGWLGGFGIFLGCALWFGYSIVPRHQDPDPAVGQPAPPLHLLSLSTDLPSSPLQASSSLPTTIPERRVTLVHFWGTWCGPCRRELPDIAALHQRFSSSPHFQLIPVTCESFDDASLPTLVTRTNHFCSQHDIDLPLYADPQTVTRRHFVHLMQREGMTYPMTILIDRHGIIRATWVGIPAGGVASIEDQICQLLEQP